MRKKVKNWPKLSIEDKNLLKSDLIDVLAREQDELAQRQIMWLAATLFKNLSTESNPSPWLDLLEFIDRSIKNSPTNEIPALKTTRTSGMALLAALVDECPQESKPYFMLTIPTLVRIMNEIDAKSTVFALTSLKTMLAYMTAPELASLDYVFEFIVADLSPRLLVSNPKSSQIIAVILSEFLQSLVEYECEFVAARAKTILSSVLALALDTRLSQTTRVMFIGFVNVLIETHKHDLVRADLVGSIVEGAFFLMVRSSDAFEMRSQMEIELLYGENLNEPNIDENENIFSAAIQVLDYCALNFSPNRIIPVVLECSQAHILSENPLSRRASLASVAITCQGCSDYYKTHHVDLCAELCARGMQDLDASVVQTAYFLLSQFSEFLLSQSSQRYSLYADRFIRIFIEAIETRLDIRSINRLTLRFYGALQSLCDNLTENELGPHLPTLMSKLMTLEIVCSSSMKIKRLIVATFSSIVGSVGAKFDPYFDYVMQLVKPYIQLEFQSRSLISVGVDEDGDEEGEEERCETVGNGSRLLEVECIELMASLARYASRDKFNSILVQNSLVLVNGVLTAEQTMETPELRAAAFHLLVALSVRLKPDDLQLDVLMPKILESLRSEDGIGIVEDRVRGVVENDEDDEEDEILGRFDRDDDDESKKVNRREADGQIQVGYIF